VKLRILSVFLVLVVMLAGCVPLPQAQSAVPTDAGGSRAPVGVTVVQGLRVLKPAIFNDTVSVLGQVIRTAASPATVTNGAAFAIAGSWQPITAAGAVTPTITIPAAGVVACIENTAAQTITIADSGNQVLTAVFAMGQYDVLCGYSDGTRFIETSRANN
jgi:hypothetical protein